MKTYLLAPVAALSGAPATMILGMAQGPTVTDHSRIATLTPQQKEILMPGPFSGINPCHAAAGAL